MDGLGWAGACFALGALCFVTLRTGRTAAAGTAGSIMRAPAFHGQSFDSVYWYNMAHSPRQATGVCRLFRFNLHQLNLRAVYTLYEQFL